MQFRRIAIRNIIRYLAGFLLIYASSIWIARAAEESVRSYVFAQAETRVNEENTLQWRIVTGVPSGFVQEQMRPVKQLLKWYLIVGFLIMICFTMYYAAERYFGFKKVMTTITGGKKTKDSLRAGNEYGIIHQSVMQLNEKGKDYELQIGELKKQNAAILLESMIVKGVYTDSERKIFEMYVICTLINQYLH